MPVFFGTENDVLDGLPNNTINKGDMDAGGTQDIYGRI
jgi:hypothetical protein